MVAYSAPLATSSSPSRISSRPSAAHYPGIYTPGPWARKTSRPAPTRGTWSIVRTSARLFATSHVPGNPCIPHNPGGWAQSRPPAAPAPRAGCRGLGRPRRRTARVSLFCSVRARVFVVVLWVGFAAGTGTFRPKVAGLRVCRMVSSEYYQGTEAAVEVEGLPRVKRGLSIRAFPGKRLGNTVHRGARSGDGRERSRARLSIWEGIRERCSEAQDSARASSTRRGGPGRSQADPYESKRRSTSRPALCLCLADVQLRPESH